MNDEFVFEVEEGYCGLFGCVGTGGEDVGEEVSDSFWFGGRWGYHYDVLFKQRDQCLFSYHR